jgi:hypothetical protein
VSGEFEWLVKQLKIRSLLNSQEFSLQLHLPQNLLDINVSWCHLITENGVEALARGCKKIRKFSSKGE